MKIKKEIKWRKKAIKWIKHQTDTCQLTEKQEYVMKRQIERLKLEIADLRLKLNSQIETHPDPKKWRELIEDIVPKDIKTYEVKPGTYKSIVDDLPKEFDKTIAREERHYCSVNCKHWNEIHQGILIKAHCDIKQNLFSIRPCNFFEAKEQENGEE